MLRRLWRVYLSASPHIDAGTLLNDLAPLLIAFGATCTAITGSYIRLANRRDQKRRREELDKQARERDASRARKKAQPRKARPRKVTRPRTAEPPEAGRHDERDAGHDGEAGN